MKKVLLAASIVLFLSVLNYAGPNFIYQYDKSVNITTYTATQICPKRMNRKYTLIVDKGSFDCYVSTYVITPGVHNAKWIQRNGGHWEENLAVYTSCYYAIAIDSGTELNITEKE